MLKGIIATIGQKINTRAKRVVICVGVVLALSSGVIALTAPPTHAIPGLDSLSGSGGGVGGLLSSYGGNTSTCAIQTVGWVVCPTMRSIAMLADYGFAYVNQSYLSIDFSITNTGSGVFKAWSVMLTIANALFVLAFMLIAYSQITGKGGTYNIKRLLPRLIIGAIMVNISYYICEIAIEISNVLGDSILNIFSGIMGKIGQSAMPLTCAANNFSCSRITDITTAVLTKSGTVWILLAPVAAIAIAIAVISAAALVLLIMRKVVISMLILVSPIAFVFYLLPNTEHYFQQWSRLLVQLLIIYPVVAFLLGTGQIISATIMNVGSGTSNTYHATDDAYFPRNGGSGSAITDLAASGAAVLPLLGVWFMMKSLTAFATNTGARVAGSLSNRRSRTEEDKLKAKLEAKEAQQVGNGNLPTYERKHAFSRRRRTASAFPSTDRETPKRNKQPSAGGDSNKPGTSLFDRMTGNINGAGNVAAQNAQADAEKKLEEINAAKIADAEAAIQGEGALAVKDEKDNAKTAKDIFNNMNESHHMKDKDSNKGGGDGGGGNGQSGGGSGPKVVGPSVEYRAPAMMQQGQGVQTGGPASGGVRQIVAVPVQVDASSFVNKSPTPGAGAMAAGAMGGAPVPRTDVEKKANARAQQYIFDSKQAIEDADKKLDELNDIRRQLGKRDDPRSTKDK